MHQEINARTAMLLGDAGLEKLHASRVAVFGVGGVGGHCAEALARCGVGAVDLIDADDVSVSNMNRQLVATLDTVGMRKTEAMRLRIAQVAPDCRVTCHDMFYLPENADTIDLSQYDYVADCIDTVSAKLELAVRCHALGVPVISAMGAGNKLDPAKFIVTDIYKTETCPLARVMRRELRKRGVPALKVVYSTETARTPVGPDGMPSRVPGSVSFVPGVAGMIMAGAMIRDLTEV